MPFILSVLGPILLLASMSALLRSLAYGRPSAMAIAIPMGGLGAVFLFYPRTAAGFILNLPALINSALLHTLQSPDRTVPAAVPSPAPSAPPTGSAAASTATSSRVPATGRGTTLHTIMEGAGFIAGTVIALILIGLLARLLLTRQRVHAAVLLESKQASAARRAKWDAGKVMLAATQDNYAHGLLDPDYFLRYPLINDVTVPAVAAVEVAREKVLIYDTDAFVDDVDWVAEFAAAVAEFSGAWQAADGVARKAGLTPIPTQFRRNIDKAVHLMAKALDPASADAERELFRDKALDLLGGSVTPRTRTLAAITASADRRAIAA